MLRELQRAAEVLNAAGHLAAAGIGAPKQALQLSAAGRVGFGLVQQLGGALQGSDGGLQAHLLAAGGLVIMRRGAQQFHAGQLGGAGSGSLKAARCGVVVVECGIRLAHGVSA